MSVLSLLFATACVLTNAIDVTSAVHKSAKGTPFDLHGKAFPYVPDHACFLLTDATGSTRAELRGYGDPEKLQCGDIVHVSGMIAPDPSGIGWSRFKFAGRRQHPCLVRFDVEPGTLHPNQCPTLEAGSGVKDSCYPAHRDKGNRR